MKAEIIFTCAQNNTKHVFKLMQQKVKGNRHVQINKRGKASHQVTKLEAKSNEMSKIFIMVFITSQSPKICH